MKKQVPPSLLIKKKYEVTGIKDSDVRLWLQKHEANCVKVYDETHNYGLMIFSHWRLKKRGGYRDDFAICPFEMQDGKLKWLPRKLYSTVTRRRRMVYDLIHIDKEMMLPFMEALSRASGLRIEKPTKEEIEKKKPQEATEARISKLVRAFRLE